MRLGYTPSTGSGVTAVASLATAPATMGLSLLPMAFDAITDLFTYRAGANEADAIVPAQEELGRYLGQLDQYLNQPLPVHMLQQAYLELSTYWQQFKGWLYSEQFTEDEDTRASDQSVETMEWQVNTRLARIQNLLLAMGAQVPPMQAMQSQYTAINRLNVPIPNQSYFPQAGTLPPVNTYPPPGPYQTAPQADMSQGLLYAGLAVVGGLLLFGR